MPILLNYNDKEIKGDVTAKGFEDYMSLYSMQFGIGRAVTMEVGEMNNRDSGRPSISEVTVSKQMDGASAMIFKDSLSGRSMPKLLVELVRTGAESGFSKFVSYELCDVILSSYSISAGDSGAPIENLCFSFSKIIMTHASSDKSNKEGTNVIVGYDLASGEPQ